MFLVAKAVAIDADIGLAFFAIPAFRTRQKRNTANRVSLIKLRIRIADDAQGNLRNESSYRESDQEQKQLGKELFCSGTFGGSSLN